MLRKIAKLAAYMKAPVKTFLFMHPVRAVKMGLAYLVVKKALELRDGRLPAASSRSTVRGRSASRSGAV